MNLLKKIRKFFDRVSKATYYYVTFDVCPDFNTGQGEMCSYTVRADSPEAATKKAIEKAMKDWSIGQDCIYTVECVRTQSDDLIYDS